MATAAERRGSLNVGWVLVLGVLGLVGAFFFYWLLMQSTFGAFSIRQMIPGRGGVGGAARVALLESDYTRQAYRITSGDSSSSWVDGVVRSWRDFLLDPDREVTFDEISDADIERGRLDRYDVLILPDVTAMSDAQIERIKAFMQRGGNVWATWTPGIYRPDGSWRGWSFLEEVVGLDFVDYVDRGSGAYQAYTDTFPGVAPPGLYVPDQDAIAAAGDTTTATQSAATPSAATPARGPNAAPAMGDGFGTPEQDLRARRQREAASFAPLNGYRWHDSTTTAPPQGNYALADTTMALLRDLDGQRRRQPAVVVTYYTWNGGTARPSLQMPYPTTGSGIRKMTLRAGTPMTAGIPGGYRIKTQVFNPAVRARLRPEAQDRTVPFGFWYDYAVEDEPDVNEAMTNSTSAAFGSYGRGRFVYLGFQRSSLYIDRNDAEDFEALGRLFANMLRYLRRQPVVWTHDWPGNYRSAAIFAGVGGQNPQALSEAASVLQSAAVPGTFFFRPEASVDASLVRRLYEQGDVGVYGDFVRRTDGRDQASWLRSAKEQLEAKTGGPVTGYRPSRIGGLSDTTMRGLRRGGYRYFLPDSIGRRGVIKMMGDAFAGLFRFNYTARSDSGVVASTGSLTATPFLQDVVRNDYEGSLYRLVYSSDLMATSGLDVLRTVAQEVRRRGMWAAAGDDLARWWAL
ncbi:MAG TPA: hypothetical protein VD948_03985, partial [Rhodothermales bacterium]|nr:hypothetical protein [Rhodothermales bacterium]